MATSWRSWLPDAPDVQQVLANSDGTAKEVLLQYVDKDVSTINPAVLPDGSNVDKAPPPRPTLTYVTYLTQKWKTLTRTWLTLSPPASNTLAARFPTAYTLIMTNRCTDLAIFPLETVLVTEDEDPVLLTARNNGHINSFNPVQLSAWCVNVDMQYCVSRHKIINVRRMRTRVTVLSLCVCLCVPCPQGA